MTSVSLRYTLEQIEDIGRRSSIRFKIDSIDVASNQVKNSKEDVFVKMKIEGSWHNIMAFVDTLEKTTFGVSVQDLNLDVTDSSGWSGSIGFVVFRER